MKCSHVLQVTGCILIEGNNLVLFIMYGTHYMVWYGETDSRQYYSGLTGLAVRTEGQGANSTLLNIKIMTENFVKTI